MTTRVWNMTHGSMATIGAFISLISGEVLKQSIYSTLCLSFIVPAVVSLAFYFVLVKPLIKRGATEFMLFAMTFAFNFIILGLLNILADYLTQVYKLRARLFLLNALDLRVFELPGVAVIAPLLCASIIVSLHLFLTKTKFGTAMRATIENPALAGAVGVNVNLVYSLSWFLAGGLAGTAGGLLPLWILCYPYIGETLLLSVFAASMVGGTASIYGAVLGGIITGLAEVWGNFFLSNLLGSWITPYRPLIPLVMLAMFLLLAPTGLSGISWRDKWLKFSRILKLRKLKLLKAGIGGRAN
jgi:branched-chain amino acid transport system permease protein